jgi:hypothetical protein
LNEWKKVVISTAFRRVMHYKVLKYMILDCNFNKKQKKPMYKMFAKKTKFFFGNWDPRYPVTLVGNVLAM